MKTALLKEVNTAAVVDFSYGQIKLLKAFVYLLREIFSKEL